MSKPIVDITGRVARLYQEPLGSFVAQRNALARDLAGAGQRDLSTRIKALTRPSAAAWVVNQLYWHERREYDALLAAGAAARDAQQARLSGRGGDLARAFAERDVIVERLTRGGERLAAAGGLKLSGDGRGRLRTSLEAIALRAGDTSLVHGQLADDVALPGLQALAGLVLGESAAADSPPARPALALVPTPERDQARAMAEALGRELAEVRAEIDRVTTDAAEARERADEAAGAAATAEQQAAAAARAVATATERLAQAQETVRVAAVRAEAAALEAAKMAEGADVLVERERDLAARLAAVSDSPPRPPAARSRRVSRKR